jgi:hypothetical protein
LFKIIFFCCFASVCLDLGSEMGAGMFLEELISPKKFTRRYNPEDQRRQMWL